MGFKIDLASLVVGRNLLFLLCFTLYLRAISKYKPPGGLYLEGRFNGGFFCVTSLGGLYYFGGAYFWNFTVIMMMMMIMYKVEKVWGCCKSQCFCPSNMSMIPTD